MGSLVCGINKEKYFSVLGFFTIFINIISMQTKISIIIPFYQEEWNVIHLFEEIKESLSNDFFGFLYEIIMVDDGSKDKTWEEILECKKMDSNVTGLQLNRNYGQSIAMETGLQKAMGDIIVTLDGDGQNDPKDIKKLYNHLLDNNLDLVAGRRMKRKDPAWMLVITKTARFLRKLLINDGVHDSGCTLRVYKKNVVENLYLWAEMHRYIIAISRINGFKIWELVIHHRPRTIGVSKYNWMKSIKWLIDLLYIWFIAKYESRPLHLFWFLGFFNFSLWTLCIFYSIYEKLFYWLSLNRSWWIILGIFFVQIWVLLFIFGMMIDIMIRSYYNTSREKRYIVKQEI